MEKFQVFRITLKTHQIQKLQTYQNAFYGNEKLTHILLLMKIDRSIYCVDKTVTNV